MRKANKLDYALITSIEKHWSKKQQKVKNQNTFLEKDKSVWVLKVYSFFSNLQIPDKVSKGQMDQFLQENFITENKIGGGLRTSEREQRQAFRD